MQTQKNTAISLFTSGGIGDLAVREAGFDLLVSNELLPDRHAVCKYNFPETQCFTGDVCESVNEIEKATNALLRGRELTLLYATPPCQGMSKNGRGKLLNAIRAGNKSPMDERNRLIIPTMKLAKQLHPEIVLLENVPEMAQTLIMDETGEVQYILDFVQRALGEEYIGQAEVVEFANFGVPQCRKRLISIFTRHPGLIAWLNDCGSFIPPTTHSARGGENKKKWVTVRESIGDLPTLDAKCKSSAHSDIPFHFVPVLDPMKYWWVSNTKPKRSAFDNQCVKCGYNDNPTHAARKGSDGINRASRNTPLYCKKCGEMLPRPSVEKDGIRVLMKGYTSAYKRMSFDRPASALTRNLSYACSDNKLHPSQNRVLSLLEAFKIHTIDQFDYSWKRADGRKVSNKTIREIIGESIPPAGLKIIVDHLMDIYFNKTKSVCQVGPLFAAHADGI